MRTALHTTSEHVNKWWTFATYSLDVVFYLLVKVLTTGQPNYLRELLNYYTPNRTLRSANQQLLEQPCVSTEFGKRSFSYLAPKIWNNLPLEIRLTSTYHTFKIRLKSFLFI